VLQHYSADKAVGKKEMYHWFHLGYGIENFILPFDGSSEIVVKHVLKLHSIHRARLSRHSMLEFLCVECISEEFNVSMAIYVGSV